MREEELSVVLSLMPLSISSIHRMAGATESMVFSERAKTSSGGPAMPE